MIYAQHDFFDNFKSASAFKDKFMMNEIVIDELARVIVTNKREVVILLRNEGINATHNDNNQRITELCLMLIKQNPNFVKTLKGLIYKTNKQLVSNAEGKTLSVSDDSLLSTSIVSVASDGSGILPKELNKRISIAESKMEKGKKGLSNNMKFMIIGVAAASIITGLIIYIVKLRKSAYMDSSLPMSNMSNAPVNGDNSDFDIE
ncbi:MAG: hypothetical protein HC892_01610 [Saprospiraceae bacterium]|nr:hypothetical protein [Saprospiraceae bacterium]